MHRLSSPELLEARIAPATLLAGGKAVTYFDGDGDLVTIRTTKGTFQDPQGGGQTQFTFAPHASGVGEQLRILDLSAFAGFDGATLTITAAPFDSGNDGDLDGDGIVNVGYIRGRNDAGNAGVDFAAVIVRGDLGAITAGDNLTDPALGSLNVLSLGAEGLATGAPDLASEFLGSVGSIRIAGDVVGASISISGTTEDGQAIGNLGTLTVGGSILGGTAEGSGAVAVVGSIGVAKIGRGLFGDTGRFSGVIQAAKIGSVTIDGPMAGGDGQSSGVIFAGTTLGSVTLGGGLFGGSGPDSGRISAQKIGPVNIAGSVVGGDFVDSVKTGSDSGLIFAFKPTQNAIPGAGTLAAVKIVGSISGGSGIGSGAVAAAVSIASVTVGGAIEGGSADFTGAINSPTLGPVKISGTVFGGDGVSSGAIVADTLLKGVSIGGALVGGEGNGSGAVRAGGNAGPIKISGAVFGGGGNRSGAIFSVTDANFSSVAVGGFLQGGSGIESAEIFTGGSASLVTIGGSVFGGTASGSGMIRIQGTLSTLVIGQDLVGGNAGTALLADTGYVVAGRIGTALVGGSIFAGSIEGAGGSLVNSGAIRTALEIGALTVRGSLVGSTDNPVIISAAGTQTPGATDVAIRALQINGSAFNAKVVAGYSPDTQQSYLGAPVNADAQIGTVKVGGNWEASDLIAGINPGVDGFFGDATDTKIAGNGVRDRPSVISKISAIVIGGQVRGTAETASIFHSGIGAEHLVSLKVGGTSVIPLLPGAKNDTFAAGRAYALGGTKGAGVPDGFDMHAYEV